MSDLILNTAHPLDLRALTRLENVRQLNISRGKKLGFDKLSHRQTRNDDLYSIYTFQIKSSLI